MKAIGYIRVLTDKQVYGHRYKMYRLLQDVNKELIKKYGIEFPLI